jgi:hypothetical protein
MGNKTAVHTIYKTTSDGERVPSVTTVLGILAKPALIEWAYQCGLAGQDYKLIRDTAGTIGTIAHYLILCHLKGKEVDLTGYSPDDVDKAENAFLSYLEWEKTHTLKPVLIEEPLVSEVFRFGGTIDCYGEMDRELTLIDFKTGKAIYPEMIYQVAAYRCLLLEKGQDVETVHILRIPRTEDEDFEERILSEGQLETGWQIFLKCLQIYQLQKKEDTKKD